MFLIINYLINIYLIILFLPISLITKIYIVVNNQNSLLLYKTARNTLQVVFSTDL